jgi:hypothetical protein
VSMPEEFKAALLAATTGSKLSAPFFMPLGVGSPVEMVVVEHEQSIGWTLACYWRGVNLGDVFAYVEAGELLMEVV